MKRYIITLVILVALMVALAFVMVGNAQEVLEKPAPILDTPPAVFDQQTSTFCQMDKVEYVEFVDALKEKAETKTLSWNELNDALAVLNSSGEPIILKDGDFDQFLANTLATEAAKYK